LRFALDDTTTRRYDGAFGANTKTTKNTKIHEGNQPKYQRLSPLAATPALRAGLGRSEGRLDHKPQECAWRLVIQPTLTFATARSAAPPTDVVRRREFLVFFVVLGEPWLFVNPRVWPFFQQPGCREFNPVVVSSCRRIVVQKAVGPVGSEGSVGANTGQTGKIAYVILRPCPLRASV
jgi:hypothetical protein